MAPAGDVKPRPRTRAEATPTKLALSMEILLDEIAACSTV
jgi:hypothetical protein